MDSDSSDTNLVIITKRARVKRFFKLYWNTVVLITTPIILIPLYNLTKDNDSKTLYVFSVTMVYWLTDVMHPGIISMVPLAAYTILTSSVPINMILPVGSEFFDCFCIMVIIVAIENCKLNRRIAVKLLLIIGCSHYRLSLLLFFCTMLLSMCLTDIFACGLMMPILKGILAELEKLGILEMHHIISNKHRSNHEQKHPKPTDFTVFYFLGIAYSATIGSIATIIGSQSNKILKMISESLFPWSPKIESPQLILLNLPGVLLMEGLLYVWMNCYFLGMFRRRTDVALELGMSEEEAQYIGTLLALQYRQLGRITFHEYVVGVIVILACTLQISFNHQYLALDSFSSSNLKISAPSILSVIILFLMPVNLNFVKFFKRRVGSTIAFTTLNESGLLAAGGAALLSGRAWSAPVLALPVVLLCKLTGEAAGNAAVTYSLLPSVAKLSVANAINPHYLMLAATLACSLPFHLVTGSPVNAMVAAYVHIPAWKMMSAGIGPSVIAVVVTWFTVAVWSKAIWNDIHLRPLWADRMVNITF